MEAFVIKNVTSGRYLTEATWIGAMNKGTDNPLLAKVFPTRAAAAKTMKSINTRFLKQVASYGSYEAMAERWSRSPDSRPELAVDRISNCTVEPI